MKFALYLALAIAVAHGAEVPTDYILGMQSPVHLDRIDLYTDGGSGALVVVDGLGREAIVIQDFSRSRHLDNKQTRYGREPGAVVLFDIRDGRELDYCGKEGTRLLQIIENLRPTNDRVVHSLKLFEEFVRKKRNAPNKSPEPTATAATPPAAQAPRQP